LVNDYKCNCPEGYEEVEEANGPKNDRTCMAVSCGSPPESSHAATTPLLAQDQKVFYSKSVAYQCEKGYTTDGKAGGKKQFSVQCQPDKRFTKPSSCKPIECAQAPSVQNAESKASSSTFNQSIDFDCLKGHSIDGTSGGDKGFSVTCKRTGEFSEPQACRPVSCGEPRDIPNSFRPSDKVVYQDSVEYECLNGFTADGQKDGKTGFVVTCQENGKFS